MRVDGYLPLREYAAIGAGRTVALVGTDGSVDWLCTPDFDSPSMFARVLDAEKGGSFRLEPTGGFETDRRYVPQTNVLETTFRTASGVVRVTDAMTTSDGTVLAPLRELVRRVEGVAGEVPRRWRFEPRFGYAAGDTRLGRRHDRYVAFCGKRAAALGAWDAGEARVADTGVEGEFTATAGNSSLLELALSDGEPLVLAGRSDTERRLTHTTDFWRGWTRDHVEYEGRWREHVERSALTLKLLVYAPSGAFVAAPTTSLPEWIGGARNWDYRYAWPRDAAYTLFAFLNLGCSSEGRAFFWWLSHATQRTRPRLLPLYTIDGAHCPPEVELGHLSGYRGSRPVRIGNGAASQTQLDVYGPVLEAMWLYADKTDSIDVESGRAVAKIADWVAQHWRDRDSGIWEVRSEPQHFIQSKVMCWVALDRVCKLAERGLVPDRIDAWRQAADEIRDYVEREGWDPERSSYVCAPGDPSLDASLLTLSLFDFQVPHERIEATVDAIRRELADGPLVARYRREDGVPGDEGYFLTCSFWLVGALANCGRIDEATALMDELVALSNDVGLYAEEVDRDGTFLGNFPQALCHLALVNAAFAVDRADVEGR